MKLRAIMLTLPILVFSSPLLAEDQAITFDSPDTHWVASDVIFPAKAGLVIPMLNYVRFEGGRFEDGFASRSAEAVPSSCMPRDGICLTAKSRAVHYAGTYSIAADGLILTNAERSDYFFDSGRADSVIDAFTFYSSMGSVAPRIEDGFMLHSTAVGEVRYVPLSLDGLDKIIGLSSFDGNSLSLFDHTACLVDFVHDLEHSEPTERSVTQQQLVSLSWLAAKMFRNNSRRNLLDLEKRLNGEVVSQASSDEAAGLIVLAIAVDAYVDHVIALRNQGVPPLTEDQRRLILHSTETEISNLQERLPSASQRTFTTSWDDLYEDLEMAAPIIASFRTGQIDYEETICPQNEG